MQEKNREQKASDTPGPGLLPKTSIVMFGFEPDAISEPNRTDDHSFVNAVFIETRGKLSRPIG